MLDERAAKEVDFILGIGGITIEPGKTLGRDLTLAGSAGDDYDAVFLGLGHNAVNSLGLENEVCGRRDSTRSSLSSAFARKILQA